MNSHPYAYQVQFTAEELLDWSVTVRQLLDETLADHEGVASKVEEFLRQKMEGQATGFCFIDSYYFINWLFYLNPPEERFLYGLTSRIISGLWKIETAAWKSVASWCSPDQIDRFVSLISQLWRMADMERAIGQLKWPNAGTSHIRNLRAMSAGFGVEIPEFYRAE